MIKPNYKNVEILGYMCSQELLSDSTEIKKYHGQEPFVYVYFNM